MAKRREQRQQQKREKDRVKRKAASKERKQSPMGLKELTTQKFIVYGDGQVRSS